MLNVLIAVVSDSYDIAQTSSLENFLNARLELVAELEARSLTEKVIFKSFSFLSNHSFNHGMKCTKVSLLDRSCFRAF